MRVQKIDNNYNVPNFSGKLTLFNTWKSCPYDRVLELEIPKEFDKTLHDMFIKTVGNIGDGPGFGTTYRNETYYEYLKKVNEIFKKLVGEAGNGSGITGNKKDFERLKVVSNIDLGEIARRDDYPSPNLAGFSHNPNSYQVSVSHDEGFIIEHEHNLSKYSIAK